MTPLWNRPSGLGFVSAFLFILPAMIVSAMFAGCSEDGSLTGKITENIPPVVRLTNGPVEGDSVQYYVHFFWAGDDPDGTIDHYEIALVPGRPVGFDPADTTGADKWTRTAATDSIIMARADEFDTVTSINLTLYAVYKKHHTFFLRAIDDRGTVSETKYCTFTAWTLAPHVFITEPVNVSPDTGPQGLGPLINFKWYGRDPIDSPWHYQNVDSTRFLFSHYNAAALRDLNAWPERFEHLWSEWRSIDAPGDSGISTVLGDDEPLPTGRSYIFAVQAKDEAGAVSSVFDVRTNVRSFMVRPPTGPLLEVSEPALGRFLFLGYDLDPRQVEVPPGFEMNFRWTADAASYGANVSSYRYGWNISDFNDPGQWETYPDPKVRSAAPKKFYSGTHTLYIETLDNLGTITLGCVEVTVIPVVLNRDLLWVDDFRSTDFQQSQYAFPTEQEHDEFWNNICLRVPTFVPENDVFDCSANNSKSPPMAMVFRYKNIIWTYSSAANEEDGSVWPRLVSFNNNEFINFLPSYLEFGGHLWTLGQSQRNSGLGAAITSTYPRTLDCFAVAPGLGCPDPNGINSMPYRDYCVSVIDKVNAQLIPQIPFTRNVTLDALRSCVIDRNDPITNSSPGFPKKLELWEEVSKPGRFFDPAVRGFTYVELYNPVYWMKYAGSMAQPCFHPIYRMKAMAQRSVLNNQVIAFWTTRYADVVGPVEGAIAAPSVHFGLPLWFFDRAQADSIADAIFEVWQIK